MDDCLNLCKNDGDCSWFSFDPQRNVCFLFKDCPSLDEACQDCVSGEKGCSPDAKKGKVKQPITIFLFVHDNVLRNILIHWSQK